VPAHAILHHAHAPVRRGEQLGVGAGLEVFGEYRAVGLEACGVHVGDVVGDDVELALQRGLPRQANEKRILHRRDSPGGGRPPSQAAFHRSSGRSPKRPLGRGVAEPVPTTKALLDQRFKEKHLALAPAGLAVRTGSPGKKYRRERRG
jgi:hypothetical protein